MEFRPRLRSHVHLERDQSGATALLDDVLSRRIGLEPAGAALAGRLDGRLLSEVITSPGDEIVFRRFTLLNLIEGSGDRIIDRVRGVRSGEQDLGISLLDGARFQCQGSGQCCQNYVFGPLDEEDVVRLDALDLKSAFPHLEPPYVETQIREDGWASKFLRSHEDRCIFLEDDRRCGLHRRFGAEAKPRLCRLYPIEYVVMYDGLRVYDKGSCATFAVSARSGLPLVDDLERLLPLLPKESSNIFHPVVQVDEYECDFGHFDRFSKRCLNLVKHSTHDGPTTLRAIARGLRAFAETLRAFPFAPGQPDAAIDALLDGDLGTWFEGEAQPADVQQGAFRLSQIFSALLVGIAAAIGQSNREKGFLSARLLRESAQLFHVASALCFHVAEPRSELDPYYAALARTPVAGPEIDEVLRLSLRQQLFGLDCLASNHALAGVLRMVLSQVLAVTGARVRAVSEGRTAAVASDLSWGHMLAARVLGRHHAAPVLVSAESGFSSILEALPACCA